MLQHRASKVSKNSVQLDIKLKKQHIENFTSFKHTEFIRDNNNNNIIIPSKTLVLSHHFFFFFGSICPIQTMFS